jgi:hypothetical protein
VIDLNLNETNAERVWGESTEKKAPSTSDLTLSGSKIPDGRVGVFTQIAVTDQTTAAKRLGCYLTNGSIKIWLFDKTAGTSDRTISIGGATYVPGRYYVEAVVSSPEASDVCSLTVNGYLVKVS